MSLINIPKSPQIVVISLDETVGVGNLRNEIPKGIEDVDKEKSWNYGHETSNSNDPNYKP